MRKILIVNDDGINADGIVRLAKTAVKYGEVFVVAPDNQRSAMSHGVTIRGSIDAWEVDFPVKGVKAYKTTGSPADCVRIGIHNIIKSTPDVVMSGINKGYNCGGDIQYSATAAAAMEAAWIGIPAIAFSEGAMGVTEVADRYLEECLSEVIDKPLGINKIWNINFPECPLSEFKGILRDRTVSERSFFTDRFNEEVLPDKTIRFHINGIYSPEFEEGTDSKAVVDGYISIGVVHNIG